jgi:hypothetical protein
LSHTSQNFTSFVHIFRYENYSPNDYSLECLVDENKYFIVSPKDVVAASLYEIDDKIKWLIEHE